MISVLKSNFFRRYLIIAILIRLLIMPFFFHPDIKTYHFQSSFLQQGVFNIYDYLLDHKLKLPLKEEFVYFPLTYFFLGGYQLIITPLLGPEFNNWLSNASITAVSEIGTYRYLFFLKFPYLLLDLLVGIILTYFFKEELQKKKAFLTWALNPFSIILIYVFSNIDIIIVLFSVLALLFLTKQKYLLSGLMLGLGAAFKAYPILLLPFFILYVQNVKHKLVLVASSLGIFTLILWPFLNSPAFRQSTLESGLTTRIVSVGLSLGFGEILFPSLIILGGLFFYGLIQKDHQKNFPLINYLTIVFLIIYSSIHFHIQWLLWIMPFAVLTTINHKKFWIPLIVLGLTAFLIPLLYNDKSMNVALLSPISLLYPTLPSVFTVISKFYDPQIIISVLHSVFLGGSLVITYQLLTIKEE